MRHSSGGLNAAVVTAYQEILAWHRNVEYSPEVQEKLAQNRHKLQAKLTELRTRPEEKRAGPVNLTLPTSYRRLNAPPFVP